MDILDANLKVYRPYFYLISFIFIFVWKNEWVFLYTCVSLFDSLFKGFTTITSGYVFLLSSGLCRVMKTESCFVEVITHD